jgi:hypothetical protein
MPIALKLTPGQAHDGLSAQNMFDTADGGDILLADRAYDSYALRIEMAPRAAWANIRALSCWRHIDVGGYKPSLVIRPRELMLQKDIGPIILAWHRF